MLPARAFGLVSMQHSSRSIDKIAALLTNSELRASNPWCQPSGLLQQDQAPAQQPRHNCPNNRVGTAATTATALSALQTISQGPGNSTAWGLLAGTSIHSSSSSSSSSSSMYDSRWAHQAPFHQLCFTRSMAFKKAGGTARQNPDTPSRNLGVRFLHNELVFPGHIILTQRGLRYRPGDNVGLGRDQTIFAKRVGRVQFSKVSIPLSNGKSKTRTLVSVALLEGLEGRSEEERKQLEGEMIQRRAMIKRQLLAHEAHEAALYFPMAAASRQPQDARTPAR